MERERQIILLLGAGAEFIRRWVEVESGATFGSVSSVDPCQPLGPAPGAGPVLPALKSSLVLPSKYSSHHFQRPVYHINASGVMSALAVAWARDVSCST